MPIAEADGTRSTAPTGRPRHQRRQQSHVGARKHRLHSFQSREMSNVRCGPVAPSADRVPMRALRVKLGGAWKMDYAGGCVHDPKLIPEGLEVMLDHLSDLSWLIDVRPGEQRIPMMERRLWDVDLDGIGSPTANQLDCLERKAKSRQHLSSRNSADMFVEPL